MKIKTTILSLFAIIALGFASATANAQDVFSKGTSTVSATVGLFGNSWRNTIVPPIQVSYEYCVLDNVFNNGNGSIGVGAMGGYFATGIKNGDIKALFHDGLIGGRASLHYQFAPKFDTYAGLFLGATIYSSRGSVTGLGNALNKATADIINATSGNSDVRFGWGAHIGARYYITPAFALTGEVGYGYSILNLGLTFRF